MERLRSPLYAQIELTFACNLGCDHCYNEPRFSTQGGTTTLNRVKREKANPERYVDIAKELVKHDVFAVTLTGGEVFSVRDRLFPTIKALADAGLEVSLNSNLTLVTEEDARKLSDFGVSGIMTSILSHDYATHDSITKRKGSHEQTVRGTQLMLKHKIYTSANMVVSQDNKRHVYQTGEFVSSLGVESFSSAQAIPSTSGGNAHLEHALGLEDITAYLEALHQVREKTGMHVKLTNPVPYCSVWESHPHLRYLLESSTCTAGRTIIQVSPTGEVKSCPMVGIGYGNILEEDLGVIWQRMSPWDENKYVPETCAPCDLVSVCRGGCRAEAERMVGSLDKKHPFSVHPIKLQNGPKSNISLILGDKIVTANGLRVRDEDNSSCVLFAKDRYMVASEVTARFVSAIGARNGLTVDRKLLDNPNAREMVSDALNAGILQKVRR